MTEIDVLSGWAENSEAHEAQGGQTAGCVARRLVWARKYWRVIYRGKECRPRLTGPYLTSLPNFARMRPTRAYFT
jgi:hypothetical protein